MFCLYDVVRLKNDDTKNGVKREYIGSIIDILDGGKAYTVEFIDENGETVDDALFAHYLEEQLERFDSRTNE